MAKGKILEIACFNLQSALLAAGNGADRIELCENYSEGGITPSFNLIFEARRKLKIPLHVIIRPRSGNFMYSPGELEMMKQQILFCKTHNIDGVVFGILTPENTIDRGICKELKQLAGKMSVTFHRAIDQCNDLKTQMKQLIEIGIERVLTSGGRKNASEGRVELKILQKQFGTQLTIMPGGGIRSDNLVDLLTTGCHEFHSAAITDGSEMADRNEIKKLHSVLSSASV